MLKWMMQRGRTLLLSDGRVGVSALILLLLLLLLLLQVTKMENHK